MSDATENPIRLHGQEGATFAKQHLIQVKVDEVSWRVLWRNPSTGEYWKEYFPQSELHGGGPAEFVKITEAEARNEFGAGNSTWSEKS